MPRGEWRGPQATLHFGAAGLFKVLAAHQFKISPRAFRAVARMSIESVSHSLAGLAQKALHGGATAETKSQKPVFIIGHWRSGTTLLHEALCADRSFNSPNTYECLFPQHFLLTEERYLKAEGRRSALSPRPMDAMTVSMSSPQEDEFALLVLGAPSFYRLLLFPGQMSLGRGLLLPSEWDSGEVDSWKRLFSAFLGAVCMARPGRLLLKSPTHTCRVGMLREMFPDAQFLHIVRQPYEVFTSTLRLWNELFALYGLQRWLSEDLPRFVLDIGEVMEQRLEADLRGLPESSYCLVRYEDLSSDPVGQLEAIYRRLGWSTLAAARADFEEYFAARVGYRTAGVRDLDPDLADLVRQRWASIFRKYDYPERLPTSKKT
ncbi:MAG: sulfotransferase [Gemmatimonadetes bacterium]|nr:sulfotransferase [Gemmatimonadota bacterium]